MIVTTNFDPVLKWTCPNPSDLKTWDIQASVEMQDFLQNGAGDPTVWHLRAL
ncbi:MAG: hypothetical protein QGG38_05145 [Nitrospinaceae bacterium]|nr:hypothetical protein [Nitrospinaceae bacterium]